MEQLSRERGTHTFEKSNEGLNLTSKSPNLAKKLMSTLQHIFVACYPKQALSASDRGIYLILAVEEYLAWRIFGDTQSFLDFARLSPFLRGNEKSHTKKS